MHAFSTIILSCIDRIDFAMNFASPLCSGDPIPDSTVYESELETFPTIDTEAQQAYDLALGDEELSECAQVLIEASDRLIALYTMLCDLIPARDCRDYDFYTVSMTLPYMTYTLSALSDIVDDLNARIIMLDAESAQVQLSDNIMFRRVAEFVVESLGEYGEAEKKIQEFKTFAFQELMKFSHGKPAKSFSFYFKDSSSMISCSFDGIDLNFVRLVDGKEDTGAGWELTISRDGDSDGYMDSSDLRNVKDMKLCVELPARFRFQEE